MWLNTQKLKKPLPAKKVLFSKTMNFKTCSFLFEVITWPKNFGGLTFDPKVSRNISSTMVSTLLGFLWNFKSCQKPCFGQKKGFWFWRVFNSGLLQARESWEQNFYAKLFSLLPNTILCEKISTKLLSCFWLSTQSWRKPRRGQKVPFEKPRF